MVFPFELVTPKTYAEINDLLRKGEVDVAFVCSGNPAAAPDAMDVIAAGVSDGKPTYHGLIIVPIDSPVRTLSDLKGKSFLFTDPDSQTGYWYTVERLKELGQDPKHFFSEVKWTGSHDHSIRAVAQHMAPGAAVSGIVYALMVKNDPGLASQLRILEKSPAFPSPPVAVRKNLPVKERNVILKILMNMPETERGRKMLSEIGFEGFVPSDNSLYLTLRSAELSQ